MFHCQGEQHGQIGDLILRHVFAIVAGQRGAGADRNGIGERVLPLDLAEYRIFQRNVVAHADIERHHVLVEGNAQLQIIAEIKKHALVNGVEHL